jgi:hypothetical protein
MGYSFMENVFHCVICNKNVDIIEVKHHSDYEERILSCGHTSNKYIRNIIESQINISDKITTTLERFKQSQRVRVEEKVINGRPSIHFSAEKINIAINNSVINVDAQDDYTFTRGFSGKEDIINKIRTLRYEVERHPLDNREKRKTLSLLKKIDYILTSMSHSGANSKLRKLKTWIIPNKWLFTPTSPYIIKIIDLIEDIMKNSQSYSN